MNNYFDKIFDNNKAIILEIEKIIIKHLLEHRLPNSSFNDDFFSLTTELVKKINHSENIMVSQDSFENMQFFMSVYLNNDIKHEDLINNQKITKNKLSYSIDYYKKTIELSLISFYNSNNNIGFSISKDSIYTNKFIHRIKTNKTMYINLYDVGKDFFNINEDVSDQLVDIGDELDTLNSLLKLYKINPEITKKFLFDNVPLSQSFIEMLPLCYDFSIADNLKNIEIYQTNIENFKFDFEVKNKKQPIIKLI